MAAGSPGGVRLVGEGVSEPWIGCGPGHRVYFVVVDRELDLLPLGGDKST